MPDVVTLTFRSCVPVTRHADHEDSLIVSLSWLLGAAARPL